MTVKALFQQRFAELSISMETSPNRDRVIYRCVHTALLLACVILVFCGFAHAVLAAIALALVFTGQDAWQVFLSRRFAIAGLILLGLYIIILLIALPIAGPQGLFAGPSGLFLLLLLVALSILWFWSADRFYQAAFRLPPPEQGTGPW